MQSIAGIAGCPMLSTLNVCKNKLALTESIAELAQCQELTNLDVSLNQLTGAAATLAIFAAMKKLTVLKVCIVLTHQRNNPHLEPRD